jgi:asparagine synthase (glutamine-hydrolysing)
MCGISGVQGRFPDGLIDEMTRCIAHRGPDDEGTHRWDEPASPGTATGFGHRRLAIIDLSPSGRQPMTIDCPVCGAHGIDDLGLIYNGELYNFLELRAELERDGHRFSSRSDSEVLLHLYGARGPEMLGSLNGIFAFAIRDGRAERRPPGIERGDLLVARDQVGVKPLYYAETTSGTAFSSEIKSILRWPAVSRELDLAAVHYSLAYLWTPAPHTGLRAVRKLPPGEALVIRRGRVERRWRYYRLPYDGEPAIRTMDAGVSAVRIAVRRAVERQLVSDVPVGAFLSGGLDSSAVVAMMRRAGAARPVCYTIAFEDRGLDGMVEDLPFARRVARHLDVELREIVVDPTLATRLEEMLWYLDEPQADPAPLNALLIAEAARRDGIPVLLSGAGGDDIFTGYRRHTAVRLEPQWTWLPGGVRTRVAAAATSAAEGRGGRWKGGAAGRRLAKAFTYAGLNGDRRTISYFWWSTEGLRRSLYSPALRRATASLDTATPLLQSLDEIPRERDPLQRMLFLETRHFLADHNLNYTDRMGMARGVEIRVPLLDIDLVALAASIDPALKQRGTTGKAVFKRAMEPFLPRDVIYRPKTGFGAPLRRWLGHELRPLVEDVLSPDVVRRRGLFDPPAVSRLVELTRRGRVDGAYLVFALIVWELWCRRFIDQHAP